jgi:hypothetical protein
MPFSRIPEVTTLIATIDSAMARADDIGNDIIRDLMPELRDTIDEINAALREVDALLFEGLRDEAVTLHDEEFATLASRLNLEDREGWPELERFFVVEGISPPPKIDYDTLSALESAHAELEELRRPLDKLRRLALERVPLSRRLALLRKLRETDPTKPVWTQAITEHEEARVAELHQEARRVLGSRDPEAIAALHAELVDPEWGVPIPRDLIKATRGADLWEQLRAAANQAAAAASGLEAGWQELQQGLPTPALIDRMRLQRMQWQQALQSAAESRQYLGDCPTIGGFVREEQIDQRIDALAPRVEEPLQWLAAQDAADAMAAQLQQVCGQLEYLCDQKPEKPAESSWLADVERLGAEAERVCQAQPGLVYPDYLRERVTKALAAVRGRTVQRRRFVLLASAAGVAVACLLIFGIWMLLSGWQKKRDSLSVLEDYLTRSRAGEFTEVPDKVVGIAGASDDADMVAAMEKIRSFVAQEEKRRGDFQAAREACDQMHQAARGVLEQRVDKARVDAWPAEAVASARAWRRARKVGGDPGKRVPAAKDIPKGNDIVAGIHAEEEDVLATLEAEQGRIETALDRLASAHVREQVRTWQEAVQAAADPRQLGEVRKQLDDLLASQNLDKVEGADELLVKQSQSRFGYESADLLRKTQRIIDARIKALEPNAAAGEPADADKVPQ